MTPATLNLPTIWRGCDWGPVTLKWKGANGQPINLTIYTPRAQTVNLDLNAQKLAQSGNTLGHTTLSLTRVQTKFLKLGTEKWDWLWERQNPQHQVFYRFAPFLSGKISIKDPVTSVEADTDPWVPDPDQPVEEPPGIEVPPFLPDLPV